MVEADVRVIGRQRCHRDGCGVADLRDLRERCVIVVVVDVWVIVVVVVDIVIGQVAVVQVESVAIVIEELHWRRYCTYRCVQRQIQRSVLTANAYRLFFLPHKDVVHHCTATEDDSETDEDTGDDGGCGVELGERVEDDACD